MRCSSFSLALLALLTCAPALVAAPTGDIPLITRAQLLPIGDGDIGGSLRAILQLPEGGSFEFFDAPGPIVGTGAAGPGVAWYEWSPAGFILSAKGATHTSITGIVGLDDLAWAGDVLWAIHGVLPPPSADPANGPFEPFFLRTWDPASAGYQPDQASTEQSTLESAATPWLQASHLLSVEIGGLAIAPGSDQMLIGFGYSTPTTGQFSDRCVGIAQFDPVTPTLKSLAWIPAGSDPLPWSLVSLEYAPDGSDLWVLLGRESHGLLVRIADPSALLARTTPITELSDLGTPVLEFDTAPCSLVFVDSGQQLLIGFAGPLLPPRGVHSPMPLAPTPAGAQPKPAPSPSRQWQYTVQLVATLRDPAALRAMSPGSGS
ncbi:MAG: hypothetical protein ABI743_12165 [bacterium]